MGARERGKWRTITERGPEHFPAETYALAEALAYLQVQLDDLHEALAAFPPGVPKDEEGLAKYVTLTNCAGRWRRRLQAS